MSNSTPRGRGRGHSRQLNGPVKTVGGSSASSNSSSSSDTMPTLTTRQVFEAAAASGKEFVPRGAPNTVLSPTAVLAQEFKPRAPTSASSAGPRPRHEFQQPHQNPGQQRSYDHGSTMASGGGNGYYQSRTADQPHAESGALGTTPHETDALRKVETLVNELLVDPCVLERDFDDVLVALNRSIVSEQAMQQLCSYLIRTGWQFEQFSYIGSRFVHLLDSNLKRDGVLGTFRGVFLRLLENNYKTAQELASDPSQQLYWINFSLFFAEVYRNLLITQPGAVRTHSIKALSIPLVENVRNLMLQPNDDTMQCTCRILKLTGSYLQLDAESALKVVTEGLRLIPKQSLSVRTNRMIQSVLDLEAQNWGMADDSVLQESPVYIATSDPLASIQQEMGGGGMSYSVASHHEPISVDVLSEAMQSSSLQPVTNPDMWNDFAAPGEEYEDEEDLALQRDMEEEYAHFLRDIEGIEDA